jgi:hypothetical protein
MWMLSHSESLILTCLNFQFIHTSKGIGEMHTMTYGGCSQTFGDSEWVRTLLLSQAYSSILDHQFTGSLYAYDSSDWYISWTTFWGPIQYSISSRQWSAYPANWLYGISEAGENKIRKSDLPPIDRDNACDLLILAIIKTFGWNPTMEQSATSGKEYFSQACAENGYCSFSFL